ncbi:MAG: hypothetical protein S4CHLAM45_06060 [Chlamydiales bacterium]|nr:hypothetical protein [Chlamydiales bacterium]MCH9619854.1 hypothetical protein [Chlamydiales bacterium]MCH9622719.1 hypothetical protein [Chlamydiales bacterium]
METKSIMHYKAPSSMEKGIKWLTKARYGKITAVVLATLLSLTIVGIPLVIYAARVWSEQIKPTGKACYTLEAMPQMEDVDEATVLALQGRIERTTEFGLVDLKSIQQNGLLPKYKMSIGDVNYYCSPPFKQPKHYYTLAFVEIDNRVFPRLFYTSGSQGVWRCLPAAHLNELGGFGWLSKGLGERTVQLPIALTTGLDQLEKTDLTKEQFFPSLIQLVNRVNSKDFAFQEEVTAQTSVQMNLSSKHKFVIKGDAIIPCPPDPKSIKMPENKDLWPDFTIKKEMNLNTPLYGDVMAKIYPSKDKSLLYLFYETAEGMVYLANVERLTVPITTFGVRQRSMQTHGMDTPLYEYFKQIPEGYDKSHTKKGKYTLNWLYVQELAIIKLYQEAHLQSS